MCKSQKINFPGKRRGKHKTEKSNVWKNYVAGVDEEISAKLRGMKTFSPVKLLRERFDSEEFWITTKLF
jgi:hypothetical protein